MSGNRRGKSYKGILQGCRAFCFAIAAESLGLHLKIISKASLFTLFHMFSHSKWKIYLGNVELGVHHQEQCAQLLCSALPHPRLQLCSPQAPKNSFSQKSDQVPPFVLKKRCVFNARFKGRMELM